MAVRVGLVSQQTAAAGAEALPRSTPEVFRPKRKLPFLLSFYSTAVGKKWVMALSGIALLGYVLVHMIGNLHLYEGPEQINTYAEALRDLPDVQYVAESVSTRLQMIYGNTNWNTSVEGTNVDLPAIRSWPLQYGSFFTDEDVRSAAKVVVLGSNVATTLYGEGVDPTDTQVRVRNHVFRVLGVMAPDSKPAIAVTSLKVEPGGYWPLIALLLSGVRGLLSRSCHSVLVRPRTNAFGS